MNHSDHKALISVKRIILQDPHRMQCLEALQELNLPQGYLAAGFLRNAIWDNIHKVSTPTPLNDVDVIYFNPSNVSKHADKDIEHALLTKMPNVRWQVKNQARMHLHHGHGAYHDCQEAISYWIEKETCVAIRLISGYPHYEFDVLAPYGLASNMAGTISINPRFPRGKVFAQRVEKKAWLVTWPHLKLG